MSAGGDAMRFLSYPRTPCVCAKGHRWYIVSVEPEIGLPTAAETPCPVCWLIEHQLLVMGVARPPGIRWGLVWRWCGRAMLGSIWTLVLFTISLHNGRTDQSTFDKLALAVIGALAFVLFGRAVEHDDDPAR